MNPLHFEEEFIKRTPTFMCFVFVNERLFLHLVTKIGNCSTQIHFYCTGRIFGFYDENVTCLLLKIGKQMCRPQNFLRKFHFFRQTYVLIKSQNSIFIFIHLMFFTELIFVVWIIFTGWKTVPFYPRIQPPATPHFSPVSFLIFSIPSELAKIG